jgi:putative DNA methylase
MPEYRKKLIEVALPLEAINKESAREKSIRHGHPSTLHLWWARRPLATCRAVLFAQMVDDPSSLPEEFPTEEAQEAERQRLFRIIEELVKWDNTTNEAVLHAARVEIARSAARNQGVSLPHNMAPAEVAAALKQYAPPTLDSFAGGGSIPLEAQRLGLEAHASDLNPVAVLINKALIEIPPKFARRPPVNLESQEKYLHKEWKGAEGLAEDVRYYGNWMRNEAWKRIGYLYPKVHLPKEYGSSEATVIAWIWARTVTCPNPACNARMPLVRTFWLSTKKGKEIWTEPIIDRTAKMVRFEIRQGKGAPEGTVNRQGAVCIACSKPAGLDYIRSEGKSGRMGTQLIAIVAEGPNGRVYLSPTQDHIKAADEARPAWEPDQELQGKCRVSVPLYGMNTFGNLFTPRQLVALTTFSDLVQGARKKVLSDASIAGLLTTGVSLNDSEANVYADAVATYLGFGVSKMTDYNSSLVTWSSSRDQARGTFTRQALPMVWDFAEVNPFAGAAGDLTVSLSGISETLERSLPASASARAQQFDATARIKDMSCFLISTDPPYYDNISYADLSDFFYIWLRRSLGSIYASLFSTLLVPKTQELVATPYRFGGDRKKAERFFEEGLGRAFARMFEIQVHDYPMTVYYAFKQAESEEDSSGHEDGSVMNASTGWETMLEGLLKSGFSITGTWPVRSERGARANNLEANSLASSTPSSESYPKRSKISSAATSHLWTLHKRQLVPAWLSSRITAKCWNPMAPRCVCEQRSSSSTRRSMRCLLSRRASTTPTRDGRSPGLSSMA